MVGVRRGHAQRDVRSRTLSDILAGQASDPAALAELYDLEHDERGDDLVFYTEFARRTRGSILDLGCGSGRLLSTLVANTRRRVVGVDGSVALMARALTRIRTDAHPRDAAATGRLEVRLADVTAFKSAERFGLVVSVDVVPHLHGTVEAEAMLSRARRVLTAAGRIVVDIPGPASLPQEDLPFETDWEREVGGTRYRRSSALRRSHDGDGALVVVLSTITEIEKADGTIARLPADFRLWYPDLRLLERVFARAGLGVSVMYGSHELDDPSDRSERLIAVADRPRHHRCA